MLSENGTVLVLERALQAPEVMLDDAVQARPGRLCLRRLRVLPLCNDVHVQVAFASDD